MVANKKTFCQRLKLKCKIVKENLSENVTFRFYGFLLLQGLCMPSFGSFQYLYTTQVLGISK